LHTCRVNTRGRPPKTLRFFWGGRGEKSKLFGYFHTHVLQNYAQLVDDSDKRVSLSFLAFRFIVRCPAIRTNSIDMPLANRIVFPLRSFIQLGSRAKPTVYGYLLVAMMAVALSGCTVLAVKPTGGLKIHSRGRLSNKMQSLLLCYSIRKGPQFWGARICESTKTKLGYRSISIYDKEPVAT